MLLHPLVRVLCCPVVALLFWSSLCFSPTGPVVSMVLFHWTLDVPTRSVVNYGICYIRQNVWFFLVLYCAVTMWLLSFCITYWVICTLYRCMPIRLGT